MNVRLVSITIFYLITLFSIQNCGPRNTLKTLSVEENQGLSALETPLPENSGNPPTATVTPTSTATPTPTPTHSATPTAIASPTNSPVAVTSVPSGIYLLSDNSGDCHLDSLQTLVDLAAQNKNFVDGFAWRTGWKELDTGTIIPNYDFHCVDEAVSGVQALGKKLTIALFVLDVPKYVLDSASVTGGTWLSPGMSATSPPITAPVPWNTAAMNHYRAFIAALASHQVYDSSRGQMVALRDHPSLGVQINAGILGIQSVRDNSNALVKHPEFTREKFRTAMFDAVRLLQQEFPTKTAYVAFWGLEDGKLPRLKDEQLSDLLGEFDGIKNPKVGLFNEALKGDAPGTMNSPYVTAYQKGHSVLLQACGAWTTHNPCSWTSGDDSPANGFNWGYTNFGTRYYEIYRSDIQNTAYESVFIEWQQILSVN